MKKKFNIIKSMFMLILIMITVFGIKTAFAAGTVPETLKIKHRDYNPPISFPQTFHIKETTDGKYVYCATYAKKIPVTSIKYTKVGKYSDPGINYILEQGYKAQNDKQYFIAQTAYWIYLMDKNEMSYSNTINTFKSNISKSSNSIAKEIRQLVSKAKSLKSYDQSDPTIEITSGNISFTLSADKSTYTSSKITIKSSEGNYKAELVNAPKGAYIKDNKKGELYVIVPASSVSATKSTFSIKLSNTKTVYQSYKYNPSNSSYQVMSATYTVNKNASTSKNMSLSVGKVTISKQDVTTKTELPGATLEIKDENGKVVKTIESTTTPTILTDLAPGKYTLVETKAPDGYELSTEAIEFEVSENGTTNPVVMYNTPKQTQYKVSINKLDSETKEQIAGAKLQILDADGNVVETITSTTTPTILTTLKPGKYTLVETEAPEGYELSTEKVSFTVVEGNDETVSVTMLNSKSKTPSEEIAVPSTSSFKTIASSMVGGLILLIGSVLIARNIKKKHEI